MDPAVAIVLAAAVSGLAATAAAVITNRVAGRANRTNAMLEWAKQLQASEQAARTAEQAARREAAESRDRADRIRDEADTDVKAIRVELDGLKGQLRDARSMAERLTDTLASVQAEVWRPEPDINSLRRLVGRRNLGLNGGG